MGKKIPNTINYGRKRSLQIIFSLFPHHKGRFTCLKEQQVSVSDKAVLLLVVSLPKKKLGFLHKNALLDITVALKTLLLIAKCAQRTMLAP